MKQLGLGLLLMAACGDTGQQLIGVPIHARGGANQIDVGPWHVQLTSAIVGFGPAYFCASSNADGDLCATAVVELARTETIDALGGDVDLGQLDGVTGTVRGAMYDWGYSWFLTHDEPSANRGAPGGHSLQLAGTATNGPSTVSFTAEIDALPSNPGAPAVRAQHTQRVLTDDDTTLTVTVEPARWMAGIDFEALSAQGATVTIVAGTNAYSALVNGMVSGAPAIFEWSP